MKYINKILLSLILVGGLAQPSFAGPKEDIDLLKADIATLKQNNLQIANAMNLLNQLQQDIQLIKGQMETTGMNKVEKDSTYKELENRILSVETKLGQMNTLFGDFRKTYTPPKTTSSESMPSNPVISTNNPGEEYNQLLAMIGTGAYREAISGLMGYINKYPSSPNVVDAQYYIGESYFSLNDFAKAITELQKFIEQAPTSPKTKAAIYRQGVAFMGLKKYPEAKLFFQKVIGNYPSAPEAGDAKKRIARIEQLLSSTPRKTGV